MGWTKKLGLLLNVPIPYINCYCEDFFLKESSTPDISLGQNKKSNISEKECYKVQNKYEQFTKINLL